MLSDVLVVGGPEKGPDRVTCSQSGIILFIQKQRIGFFMIKGNLLRIEPNELIQCRRNTFDIPRLAVNIQYGTPIPRVVWSEFSGTQCSFPGAGEVFVVNVYFGELKMGLVVAWLQLNDLLECLFRQRQLSGRFLPYPLVI